MQIQKGKKVMITASVGVRFLSHLSHRTNHVPGAIGFIDDSALNDGDDSLGAFINVNGQIAHNCKTGYVVCGTNTIFEKFTRMNQAQLGFMWRS